MNFKSTLFSILTEAKKNEKFKQKLIQLGVDEYNAEGLVEIAGPLSVFLAFKILEKYEKDYYDASFKSVNVNTIPKQERFALVNGSNSFIREKDKVRSIMDWFYVGLNNNIKPYENLTFNELYEESVRWHESLGIGKSKIDYTENNEIILDFRQDGEGFYWVDLGDKQCNEEAERMGHCGRSDGRLYSLRSYKKIQNNHTLNKSHLTASIHNGALLQLKGAKNSKPSEEYHKYILPLIYFNDDDGFLIDSFGYEYESGKDFKISDLDKNSIIELYEKRPELFNSRAQKKILYSLGLLERNKMDSIFTLSIPPKYIVDYLKTEFRYDFFVNILNNDTDRYWDLYNYVDWEYTANNYIDEETSIRIKKMLEAMAEKDGIDFDGTLSLSEMIDEYDDRSIVNAIKLAQSDIELYEYLGYLYDTLRNALSEYGDIASFDDNGVTIIVDLNKYTNDVDDYYLDQYYANCNENNLECVFDEILNGGWIEKPRFDLNDYWYPDIDEHYLNELINERLNEI